MKTIFFDEAGFTGYNLLDPNQPIFTIGSHDINEYEAEKMLKNAFPKYKGSEFKFSNIWGSSNQNGLLRLAEDLGKFEDHIFVFVVDKKFAVLAKIVDWLLEPLITRTGYDFYADGFNWKYANYIHFALTVIEPSTILDNLITEYQHFSRNPSKDSLVSLHENLVKWSKQTQEPFLQSILMDMAAGTKNLPDEIDIEDFRTTNDLQLTTMQACVAWWRQHFSEDFQVIHDSSSNFARQKEFWEKATGSHGKKFHRPLGDGSFVEYPLRVLETCSINSKNSYSIQLADIIAGFFSKHFDENRSNDTEMFLDKCIAHGFGGVTFNSIRQQYIFPKSGPIIANGPDVIDIISNRFL